MIRAKKVHPKPSKRSYAAYKDTKRYPGNMVVDVQLYSAESPEEKIAALTEQLNMAKIIIGSIAVSGQGYDNWNPVLKANVKKFMEL